jgi:hypothetical protein
VLQVFLPVECLISGDIEFINIDPVIPIKSDVFINSIEVLVDRVRHKLACRHHAVTAHGYNILGET